MPLSRQQFSDAYKKLPYPVREFIASPEFGETVERIGEHNGLTGTALTAFIDTVTEMALGVLPPSELPKRFSSAQIPEKVIPILLQEVDVKVMQPLAAKFKEKVEPEAVEVSPTPPEIVPAVKTVPQIDQALRSPVPAANNSRPQIVPTVRPVPIAAPVPSILQQSPPPSIPPMRTMAMDVEATHGQKAVEKTTRLDPTPARAALPPVSLPKPVVPPVPPPTTPALGAISTVTPKPQPVRVESKNYGVDPYREPVE